MENDSNNVMVIPNGIQLAAALKEYDEVEFNIGEVEVEISLSSNGDYNYTYCGNGIEDGGCLDCTHLEAIETVFEEVKERFGTSNSPKSAYPFGHLVYKNGKEYALKGMGGSGVHAFTSTDGKNSREYIREEDIEGLSVKGESYCIAMAPLNDSTLVTGHKPVQLTLF